MNKLKKCYDPEIPINVVDLGLIYDVKIKDSKIDVDMTLTNTGCPMRSSIIEEIKNSLLQIKGVKNVNVNLVWDPPWTPDRINKKVRKKFGI